MKSAWNHIPSQHFDCGDVVTQVRSTGAGQRTDLPSSTLTYSYNDSGEKIHTSTPVGAFSYARDAAGRLVGLTNNYGKTFNFRYDLNQRLTEITSPAAITSFEFDSVGFNTKINHSRRSGAVIERFIYGRDLVGNRVTKTTTQGQSSYAYDQQYQLVQSITPSLPQENFSYDPIGNRVSDNNSTYVYDASKQELREDYKYLYQYDGNGNLAMKQVANKGLMPHEK